MINRPLSCTTTTTQRAIQLMTLCILSWHRGQRLPLLSKNRLLLVMVGAKLSLVGTTESTYEYIKLGN